MSSPNPASMLDYNGVEGCLEPVLVQSGHPIQGVQLVGFCQVRENADFSARSWLPAGPDPLSGPHMQPLWWDGVVVTPTHAHLSMN